MADLSTTKLVDLDLLGKYNTKVKADYDGKIGTLTNLTTTAKTSTVAAVNELDGEIGDLSTITVETATGVKATSVVAALNQLETELQAGGTGSVVKVESAKTPTAGYLKTYNVIQGKNADGSDKIVGTIDIPKDFLVKSGSIVKDPTGQPSGTYLELVINTKDASGTDETIYINVADLVDVYTAAASAAQVQIAISATNEISATIVASSVTATELASDAVETAKIKDANVTAAKLATDSIVSAIDSTTGIVSSSTMDATTVSLLQKAYDAVQESDITLATENEMITACGF